MAVGPVDSKGAGTHKDVIVVTGATGAQGGGLVRAILNDPAADVSVRAVTRRPRSEQALALARLGAQSVAADFDDLPSLIDAFRGATAAYCVTNFWEHVSPERELVQAEHLAEAAREAGVRHVIWSTLEDTRQWVPLSDDRMPTLMGAYKVPHFDAKGAANRYFLERELPVTFLLTSFYWENFIHMGMGPQRRPDGSLAIGLPLGEAKLPGIASEDIGRCAWGIFKKGRDCIGKTIGVAGQHLTGADMAAAMSRALGETVQYDAMPPEVYRALGFPGADDLGNMFQFNRDFSDAFCAARSITESRALNPALQSFDTWLSQNKL